MPLSNGQQFAGYTVQRLLGSGGMGEVYLVQHPRLPRLDALKILPTHLTADDSYRQRFHREADLAATLWHPHIVGVHDRGEHDGQLWISMDFVDGTDARHLLSTHPNGLAVEDVLDVVDAVADALDFAHHGGLLHRDVKPANVLITTPPTGRKRILLADFGIARYADDVSGLTATNTTLGTVSYAAPEQLIGETLTGGADQYALAATAYHLLKGAPPFVNTNPAVVIGQHLNATPPPLAASRPELAALDPVLGRALAKSPAERFPHCLDFAAALRAASTGIAEPTRDERPAAKPPRAPLPSDDTWLAPDSPSAEPTAAAAQPQLAESPTRSRSLAAVAVLVVLAVFLVAAGVFAAVSTRLADRHAAAPPQWMPYVDAGKQGALNLTSIDHATVDADVQRILDGATGAFYSDFAARAEPFKQTVREAQSTSKGTVTGAGLEKLDGNHADVLVAVTVNTSNAGAPQQEPRAWRMRMGVVRTGDTYKVNSVDFVK